MKKLALAFALMIMTQSAHAIFVAVPKGQGRIDYTAPSRILLSGRGTDLGIQPHQTAMGRALLYKRNYSQDQVVLISVFENDGNEALLTGAGWTIIYKDDKKLNTDSSLAEINKFAKLRSLEFFGHNSPTLGTQTDGLGFRFDTRGAAVAALKSKFVEGAYAMIHGCNSGWILAQDLSKAWQIPVSGAFTETRFERLHSDGHFYVSDNAKAPSANWAARNSKLDNADCASGGCTRMRPRFAAYDGKWGNFRGPILSHYKFFCQLDVRECEKRMAGSLYGFIADNPLKTNSTLQDFKAVAKDYLCPIYKDRKITNDCFNQLDAIEAGQGNMAISYVVGDQQLACTLKECKATMICDDHKCTVSNQVSKGAQTFAQEYLHMLNGFKALQQDGGL